ncbi:MAG: hypothetical protein ACLFNS_07810, partial [Desulfobacterales bacterium]
MKVLKALTVMILWAIMGLPADSVFAGEEQRRYRLDDVVVSTSRSEVTPSDAPQSISVISEEEIMATPFDRVEDILRF